MAGPDAAKKAALEQGRSLEASGDIDGALQAFLRAGAGDEAVRLLIGARRFNEAGKLLLGGIGTDATKVGGLDAARKKLALRAAICFANGGESRLAVELFVNLGEKARAIELLEKVGDFATATRLEQAAPGELTNFGYAAAMSTGQGATTLAVAQKLEAQGKHEPALEAYTQLKQFGHAGRMAHLLKRPGLAAELFQQGGMPYEAAVCYLEVGDTGKCLDNLIRVPREDRRYRSACIHAVRIATDLNLLDFQLENFLGKFVSSGPADDREMDTFYALGKLYRKHDIDDSAREVYEKILGRNPAYRDTAALLDKLEEESGSSRAYERIVKEEQTFKAGVARASGPSGRERSTTQPVDLPDLPELPSLPAVVAPAASMVLPPPPAGASGGVPPGPESLSSAAAAARPPRSTSVNDPLGHMATIAPTPTPAPSSGGIPVPYLPSALLSQSQPTGLISKASTSTHPGSTGGSGLVEGAVVNERYRLEKKIGQGGMAAVYRAVDRELEETIAIKFFSHLVADEQMLVRFKSEVTLSRQLNHPNIIRLYDIGTYHDYKYITMELLTGSDLNRHLDGKPIDFDKGLDYLVQACGALQVVHDRGFIHRDIKPDNFFITTDGVLKVMDFGIAKRKSSPKGLTVAGMIAGTPEYMSPEQINDFGSVSHLTDLYALGCLAYQMFTGSLPFVHEELMPLLVMHVTQAPEPPRARNPKISLELEQVILKLLEKEPAKRFQSCRDLGYKLSELRRRLPGNR